MKLVKIILEKVLSLIKHTKDVYDNVGDESNQATNTMIVGPLNNFTYGGIPVELRSTLDDDGIIPLRFKLEADVSLKYATIDGTNGFAIIAESAAIKGGNDAGALFIVKADPEMLRDISAICFNTVSRYYIMLQSSQISKHIYDNIGIGIQPGGYKN